MRAAPEKIFLAVVAVIGAATVALHAAGMSQRMSYWWGVHMYRFFPAAVGFGASLVTVAAGAVVVLWRRSEHPGGGARRVPFAVVATAGAAAAGALMWLARTRNTYLGDGNVIGSSLAAGGGLHPREPLTVMINHALFRAATALGAGGTPEAVAQHAVAFGSVVAGVAFVAVSWWLAAEIVALADDRHAPGRGVTALVWLVVVAQGYAQLFFGYVENYTYYTLALALYLWSALRFIRGALPLAVPAAALVFALLLHVSAAVLAPSFAVLAVYGLVRGDLRRSTLRDLGIAVVLLVVARIVLGAVQPGYDMFREIIAGAGNVRRMGTTNAPGYLTSPRHLFDFTNEHLLIGPLGLWLFLPAVVVGALVARARRASVLFLAVAGWAYLVVCWLAGDSNLGYARNWDLFAPAGLVFTVAGVGAFAASASARRALVSALSCAALVSLFHTVPWIATNASEARSLARLRSLPLGLGRTEVLVSSWYTQHGQKEEAHRWLERAVAVNPSNNNAYYLLGADYFDAGDMTRAAAAFATAAKLRPDKILFRQMLVVSLFGCGRGAEAVPHLEFILSKGQGGAPDWALYGEALKAAGRPDDARAAFEKALPLFQETYRQIPQDFAVNLGIAQILYNLDRYDESLPYSQRALATQPNSDAALALAGYTLRRLGRNADANDYFRRCLAANPNYPDRAEMEAFLAAP